MSYLAGRVPPPTPFLPTLRHNAATDESLLLHTGPVFDDMTLDEEDFLVPFGRSVPGPSSLGFTTSTPARGARAASASPLGGPSPNILRAATAGNEGQEEEGRAGPSRVRTLFSESPLLPPTDLTLDFADESLGQLNAQETIHDETSGSVDTVQRESQSQADVSSSTAWSAISAYASASKRYSPVGADMSLASSSSASTSSRKRRRSPSPNRDDLFARRRRDSDRRSSHSKAITIDSVVLPDPVAEGSSFQRSVSRSFASSSRGRSASNGDTSGHGELADSTLSARSQNVDERSLMLSSAVRDPSRRVSGLNVPARSSQGHPEAQSSDEQSAAPMPSLFMQTPVREEHREIMPHPESAQPPRSVAKRLSGLLSSIIGSARAGADDEHSALRDIPSPQFESGLGTGNSESHSSASQPHGDVQEDDSRDQHPVPEPEPLRAPSRTAATAPPVALPPGFRPLTRPAAPAFSTARRALQPRVHDEANRPHPRSVPAAGAAPRPATKSAFAAAALARLPPPGRGSTPAARPVVVKPVERATNIASRRNVFDKPGMRPPPAPVTQNMKRTVPLTGHTPGKASRLRAEQRQRAMQQATSGKENTAV